MLARESSRATLAFSALAIKLARSAGLLAGLGSGRDSVRIRLPALARAIPWLAGWSSAEAAQFGDRRPATAEGFASELKFTTCFARAG